MQEYRQDLGFPDLSFFKKFGNLAVFRELMEGLVGDEDSCRIMWNIAHSCNYYKQKATESEKA